MKNTIKHIIVAMALTLGVSYITNAQVTAQKIGANPTNIAPSAVLDIESANKGVLFPRVALTAANLAGPIVSPATGLTVYNTATAGTAPNNVSPGYYYWNGSRWVKLAVETPPIAFAKTVYVNATSPNLVAADIFDEANPPLSNDNALKAKDDNLYVASDGSTWTYNTVASNYKTYAVAPSTPFNIATTTTDAGNNKTSAIERVGSVSVTNGLLRASSGNTNSITIDPTQGPGPRLSLGTTLLPNSYFELGAYGGMNNFDTKGRDFNIFSAARANALFLESDNGNIGIGTNTPLTTIHVQSSTAATASINADATLLRLSRPTTGSVKNGNIAQFNLGSYSTGGAAHTRLDFALNNTDLASLTTVMTMQANGNVGIGISSPSARFQVNTPSGNNNVARFITEGTGTNWATIGLGNGSGPWTGLASGDSKFQIRHFTNNTSILHADLVSGNVGVGTVNPTAQFEVGSSTVATTTVNADRKMLRLSIPDNLSTKNGNVAEFNMGSYAAGGAALTRLDLALNNGSDNTVSQVMTWQANGNVGIGTTAPISKLEVDGAATNKNAFYAGSGTTIDFSKSNLAYTDASPGAFTLNNMKDGGTYTLAVQGKTAGTASFTASGFTFKSPNNGPTINSKETIYTFIVMGTSVYVYMTAGINDL